MAVEIIKTLTFHTPTENQDVLDKYINTYKERYPEQGKLKKPDVLNDFFQKLVIPALNQETEKLQKEIDNYKNPK